MYWATIESKLSNESSNRTVSNLSEWPASQTTTVQLNISMGGAAFVLEAHLVYAALQGYCDDLGVVIGRTKDGEPFVETFQEFNRHQYWRR